MISVARRTALVLALVSAMAITMNACTPQQNAAIINATMTKYGVNFLNTVTMIGIAACESALTDRAENATSHAKGLFQFMPGTWASVRKTHFGGVAADPFSPFDNAATAAALLNDPHYGFSPWNGDHYLEWIRGHQSSIPCYCKKAMTDAGYGAYTPATCTGG